MICPADESAFGGIAPSCGPRQPLIETVIGDHSRVEGGGQVELVDDDHCDEEQDDPDECVDNIVCRNGEDSNYCNVLWKTFNLFSL